MDIWVVLTGEAVMARRDVGWEVRQTWWEAAEEGLQLRAQRVSRYSA